jgi:hypothetical protein
VPLGHPRKLGREVRTHPRREQGGAVLVALAAAHHDLAAFHVDVLDPDGEALRGGHPSRAAEQFRDPERAHSCAPGAWTRGEAGLSGRPVSTEQLWQIFESGAADSEARAGAAIALRERLDESCRRRLRVVAATTASPKLRTAIESAASDDDASLEEALAALESEPLEDGAVQRVEVR